MATLLNKNNQNVGFIHSFFLCLNRFLSFDCFSLCFQVWWAAEHDESAQRIGVNARRFATRILGEEMVLYLMLPVCLCALTTTRSHVLFLVKTPLLFFYPFFKMYAILGFVLQSVLVGFFYIFTGSPIPLTCAQGGCRAANLQNVGSLGFDSRDFRPNQRAAGSSEEVCHHGGG